MTIEKNKDLVKRIRYYIEIRGGPAKDENGNYVGTVWPMMLEAADELERLSNEAENLSLKKIFFNKIKSFFKKQKEENKILMPIELTDKQADAALCATASWLNIEGSGLTVNREKMKARYKALVKHIESM